MSQFVASAAVYKFYLRPALFLGQRLLQPVLCLCPGLLDSDSFGGSMVTLLRIFGFFLVGLVGYHYINDAIGLSIAASVALILFGGSLILLYRGYDPDGGMWLGWGLIIAGCLILSSFETFNWLLLIPIGLYVSGYRLAGLPFELGSGGDGGGFGSDGDSCDFGGGDCGGD
jgi:hypothetical protein